jgi:SAM-dependent methyltransferase
MAELLDQIKSRARGQNAFQLWHQAKDILVQLARTGKLRPSNSIARNLRQWSSWDWSRKGEEWTPSLEWKEALVHDVLDPNIREGSRILEIGPGAGRWTEYLIQRSSHLTCVDLTPECIRACRKRFAGFGNVDFIVNDGRDLSFLPPRSVDCVWSFDVFVHIESSDVENYVRQLSSILVGGGRGVIHHAKGGIQQWGWRSDMTARKMIDFCERNGLRPLDQLESWSDGRYQINPNMPGQNVDVITIFEKPL